MTRRHDALIPLTHDHHHALHNLRILLQAAGAGDAERLATARGFLDFFASHSVEHFREEEEVVFPLVVLHPDAPVEGIDRVLHEHVLLYGLVRRLRAEVEAGQVSPDTAREIADLLRAHIRFEEDVLFPEIERLVGDELEEISLAPRARPGTD